MNTLHQEFQISFRYPVHFTTDLFALENPLFAQVLGAPTPCPPPPMLREGGLSPSTSSTLPNAEVAGMHASLLLSSPSPSIGGGGQGVGASSHKVLFVLDEGVHRHHPQLPASIEAYCEARRIPLAGPLRRVPGGERVKNEHDWVLMLHHAIERAGLCRHSSLAAIGGGAVLDMAGLAAATAHRGVRLIRIPTTVLSQNDSGVGVKNGVNAFGKKNFLGTFAPPYAVLNDSRFLTTLSDRDWRSGIAEAIKVALIKDATFFEFLEDRAAALASRDREAMQHLIHRCAELHLRHIASCGDPFELGSARPLDFGHWSAHKLEQLSGYRLRHGEAVAVGIALDTTYSYLSGLIPEADWRRILHLLRETGFAIHVPELSDHCRERDNPRCILQGLREFREHLGGELTITLLQGIGRALEVHEINERRMIEGIALLERLAEGIGADGFAARTDPSDLSDSIPEHRDPGSFPCRIHLSSKGGAIWKPAPRGRRARAR